jgi:hypothetical protein
MTSFDLNKRLHNRIEVECRKGDRVMEDRVGKSTAGRLADAAIGDLSPHNAGVAVPTAYQIRAY